MVRNDLFSWLRGPSCPRFFLPDFKNMFLNIYANDKIKDKILAQLKNASYLWRVIKNNITMKNKNFLKPKGVNEERYFTCDRELFDFVLKMNNQTMEQFYDSCRKFQSVLNETLIPLDSKDDFRYIRIGNFIYAISHGKFVRKSNTYDYNLLTVQDARDLSHNDCRKLFNY